MTKPATTPRRMWNLALALALTVVFGTIAAACSSADTADRGEATADEPSAAPTMVGHVHGIGFMDGRVFVATHNGLIVVDPEDGAVERAGATAHDLMGFAIPEQGRMIASGHPAPGDTDHPPHLGLIESRDGGSTWDPVSLGGEADFHVMDARGSRVIGYDTFGDRLLHSADDGRTWERRVLPERLVSLALDPAGGSTIVGSTGDRLLRSLDGGRSWSPLEAPAALLAWDEGGTITAVRADGSVGLSDDAGDNWRVSGSAPVPPAATSRADGTLYLAGIDGSVRASDDDGDTWRTLARLEVHG